MRDLSAVLLCLALGGCASVNYILEEYRGVQAAEVTMPDDTYRVFDRPAVSKMMVTSSLSSAMGQGLGSGLLLGAVDNTPPKPRFDAAALRYLENTERNGCRVIDSYLLVKPQFEVKYDCTPIATPPPSSRR